MDLVKFFEDQLTWYHVRFDSHPEHGKVEEFLNKFESKKYAYSRERDPKDHTHMVIGTRLKPTAPTVSRWLKTYFNMVGSQKGTSQVRTTVVRALTYIAKEKDIHYAGFTKEYIQACVAHSTVKFSKEKVANDLFELESGYYADRITFREFALGYSDIKDKYGQPHSRNQFTSYIVKHKMHKDEHYRVRWVDKIVDDVLWGEEDCK